MGNLINDDDKIEEIIANKRHKELLEAIKNIKLQPKDDYELKQLLKSVQDAISNFTVSVESPKIDIPQSNVNVNVDNTELVKTFRAIADEVIKSNEKLCYKVDSMISESKRTKKFNMKVNRNKLIDTIESVNGEIE